MMSQEEFVNRATTKHNGKYSYEKSEYKGSKRKVLIFCKFHQDYFYQIAGDHLYGQGCPKCAGVVKKTQEQFLSEVRKVHGENRYDYSETIYRGLKYKIIIKCNDCGYIFQQKASDHLIKKQGCANCYGNKKVTTEEYIKSAILVHGYAYGYDRVVIDGNKSKIMVYCKFHKKYFEISAHHHLEGQGCQICSQPKKYLPITKVPVDRSFENFVRQARLIHANNYEYYKHTYVNKSTETKIHCNLCGGEFFQEPCRHLSGSGCILCKMSHGEKCIYGILLEFGLEIIPQKRFSNCVRKKPLPFDFCIMYNKHVVGLIEFQGIQHFQIGWWSKNKNKAIIRLQETIEADNIKDTWCFVNNIPLLKIYYYEAKNIRSLVTKFVSVITNADK